MTQGFVNKSGIALPLAVNQGGTGAVTAAAARTELGLAYASQAEQETGTATDKVVAPGTQHYSQSACKGWLAYNHITPAVLGSYNVTSVADDSTGNFTITWDVDFSTVNYAMAASSSNFHIYHSGTVNVGTIGFATATSANAAVDNARNEIIAFGDQ